MDDETFIASRLSEAGIAADQEAIQLVKQCAIYGKTGCKDREIMSLSAALSTLASKTSSSVFKHLEKKYAETTSSAIQSTTAVAGKVGQVLGAAGAVLSIATFVFNLVADIQDREETNEIAQRHLSGFDAATGLQPESIRIVAAVKQIVERGFDQHELRSINAESSVTVDFLVNTIIPLAHDLERLDDQTVARYHVRLVERINVNRKDIHIHFQRFSSGVEGIATRADYQIDTNHLVCYAKACTLDAFLTFYELLLSNRMHDGLVEHNCSLFTQRNHDAVAVLQKYLEMYTTGRTQMIKTYYYYDGHNALHRDCVYDDASPLDNIISPIPLEEVARSGVDWNGCGMEMVNGHCKFWSAIWVNRTHPAAQRTKHAAIRYIQGRTVIDTGEDWQRLVGRPQDTMTRLEGKIKAITFWTQRAMIKANIKHMQESVLQKIAEQAKIGEHKAGSGWWPW
ncbi:hypothetical protein M436DRAFT_68383 [Aureobasidium namibiae CBS 147.97]|uniref:Uncharacterized protein n=1 Tax=Aureobasidium namibiae CBS 147.97 TaxID=1043004 RepID=A0A074W4Y0_9PEZI|nr:uncharacterized protein M436DRAFT_68383 [Aureobasidium namibiae CBS 147.97]KEQ68175.1 hypothetical protein M436DRAFT_68383 [Aureobasidium namibiae CBS 147.97]